MAYLVSKSMRRKGELLPGAAVSFEPADSWGSGTHARQSDGCR